MTSIDTHKSTLYIEKVHRAVIFTIVQLSCSNGRGHGHVTSLNFGK